MKNIIRFLESQRGFHAPSLIKWALEALELKPDSSKTIVVAGTNGKGSTCAILQTLLMAAGKNVGFYSSPHLVRINERIKFNGEDVSDDDFCKIFRIVREKVQLYDLSCFEYLTLMAAYYFFALKKVDFAIFEAGLGGVFDATRSIPHDVSVITRLGLDHESILGNSLAEIAGNKFGIIDEGNRVFHTKFSDEAVIKLSQKIANERRAELIEAYSYDCVVEISDKYPDFWIKSQWGDFKMNLPGRRAAENTALAATIFDRVCGNPRDFLPAVEKVNWPGRMEKIRYRNRDVFLSGDHNPQGIDSLLDILRHYKFDGIRFVVGICRDKKHSQMLEKLADFPRSVLYLTETPEKTLPIQDYERKFLRSAAFVSSDPEEALESALSDCAENDLIAITGSLYLVGKLRRHILGI
jgi:dihydrofolate synthase/folylpolyglutamate synthase